MRGRKRKLTDEEAEHVREWYFREDKMSTYKLARLFHVSAGTIQRILDRKGPYHDIGLSEKDTKVGAGDKARKSHQEDFLRFSQRAADTRADFTRKENEALQCGEGCDPRDRSGLTEEEMKCQYCGLIHEGVLCHRIKSIEYFPNGTVIKRIEFRDPEPCHSGLPGSRAGASADATAGAVAPSHLASS